MMTSEQIEELFDAAMKVSNQATRSAEFARAMFPAGLEKSLDELSLVLNKYEPSVKALKTVLANIREALVVLGENGKIESGSVESVKLREARDLLKDYYT